MSWGALSMVSESSYGTCFHRKPYAARGPPVRSHPSMRPGPQRQKWQTGVNPHARPEGDPVKYRLVTRSDFDGLVCAVLLRHLDMIDDITFVHPKDMQDGKIEITERDITTNLPYVD